MAFLPLISPSLASADPLHLRRAVRLAEERSCRDLHLDIEDGNFVPNITFGVRTVGAVRGATPLPFSLHLMAENPMDWLPRLSPFGPISIAFAHWEALPYPRAWVGLCRKLEIPPGIALNPRTPVENLEYLGGELAGVLLLSSEPDGMGEGFLPSALDRVRRARELLPAPAQVWVDGGVSRELLPGLGELGADHAVLGRAFFGQTPPP